MKPDGTWIDVEGAGQHFRTAKLHGCTRGTGVEGWVSVTTEIGSTEFTALFPGRYTNEQLVTLKRYSERFDYSLKKLLRHLEERRLPECLPNSIEEAVVEKREGVEPGNR